MAYNELVKNFGGIRSYMRDFYVYGFKSRNEYDRKSARSYDDERRRIESWLDGYMRFLNTADGKNVFISIDTRETVHNPLYNAFKAKSFTSGDITLHFCIFDILNEPDTEMTSGQITDALSDDYLSAFPGQKIFDESTVRKKLKEYEKLGLLKTRRQGRTVLYSREAETEPVNTDVLDFFSEVLPCGAAGSFLLDREHEKGDRFAFKHHYINGALDSEILCSLFEIIREGKKAVILNSGRGSEKPVKIEITPLKVYISVQNGRQYLIAYIHENQRISTFRTDYITDVTAGDTDPDADRYRDDLCEMSGHMWGVNTGFHSGELCHVEFTVEFSENERFIADRLVREKRCGTVEFTDDTHCRFSADVCDVSEMIPWIRTFICRITDLSFSDREAEERFKNDLKAMYRLYGLEDDTNDIQ